jgi:hypothetical protein
MLRCLHCLPIWPHLGRETSPPLLLLLLLLLLRLFYVTEQLA